MSAITVLVSAVVVSYLLDRLGIRIAAVPVLLASVVCGAVPIVWQPRPHARGDVAALAVVVLGVLGALVWLAWPELLPVGGGSDLTHHLQLIDFIDRHGRLAHTAADALLVGNMVNYTPGSHLLASLAGAWAGTDGLHAVHAVLALTVALKAGFVFLIARRMLGGQLRAPFAVGAVLLLFASYDYFIGSFARFSFFAQVVSELFAVVMWLALVLWERRPSAVAAALFGIAGVGVFLTWPVWIGPPVLVLLGLGLARGDFPRASRWRYLAAALGPIALVAALHAAGRGESVAIVQTGGAAFWPSAARVGLPLLLLAVAGTVAALSSGPGRVTVVLLAAIALQGLALFVVARVSGADSPYMALKMPHLAIYPMAALAALALASVWRLLERVVAPIVRLPRAWTSAIAWLLVAGCAGWTAVRFASVPQPERAITENTYRAGRWARDHVPTNCIEYLVAQDSTSVLVAPSRAPQPDAAAARSGSTRLRLPRCARALDHRHELPRDDRRFLAGSAGGAGGPGGAGAVRPHRGREEAGDVGLPRTLNGLESRGPLTWRANARRALRRA